MISYFKTEVYLYFHCLTFSIQVFQLHVLLNCESRFKANYLVGAKYLVG